MAYRHRFVPKNGSDTWFFFLSEHPTHWVLRIDKIGRFQGSHFKKYRLICYRLFPILLLKHFCYSSCLYGNSLNFLVSDWLLELNTGFWLANQWDSCVRQGHEASYYLNCNSNSFLKFIWFKDYSNNSNLSHLLMNFCDLVKKVVSWV